MPFCAERVTLGRRICYKKDKYSDITNNNNEYQGNKNK
jgi:hypothetical protein